MSVPDELKLRYETIVTGNAFDELLDLAQKTCLSFPDSYTRNFGKLQSQTEYSQAYVLAQRIGLWPTRQLFDYYAEASRPKDMEGAYTGKEVPSTEELLDFPNLPLDPEIQDKIEALGQSLLDEAYLCLGEDAAQKIEEFKNAQSQAERIAICEWVSQRVTDIYEKFPGLSDDESDEEVQARDPETFYHHPLKLSPKVIGQYPDVRIKPTCLGVSIMVASFFEQAGARYLHGGVVRSGNGNVRLMQRKLMRQVGHAVRTTGTPPVEELKNRFNKAGFDLSHSYGVNRGYHADVLVDVGDGDWMQVDPYFEATTLIECGEEKVGKLYDAMTESGVRGAEGMLYDNLPPRAGDAGPFLRKMLKDLPSVKELNTFLRTVDPMNADKEIIEQYFCAYYSWDRKYCQPVKFYLDQLTKLAQKDDPEKNEDLYMWGVLVDAIADYAFPGAKEDLDISPYVKKCQENSNYRRKSAERLRLVPLMALLKLQFEYAKAVERHEIPTQHTATELGLPAYRIGVCVLSDFAAHTSDELPFSFWATYWPSHITFGEHMDGINSPSQGLLAMEVRKAVKHSRLTYDDIYLRIA